MLKKDDELELIIEDMGSDGEGIAKYEGITLFVKDAVIGDRIRAKIMKMKKSYGYARMMEIITPSADRVEPVCPVARQCGGCQLAHTSYEFQLKYKENKVINCLERIGRICDASSIMEPIIGMDEPFRYRNKAQFPVALDTPKNGGGVKIGFYAGRSHNIIDMEDCCIQDEVNAVIVRAAKELINEFPKHLMPYDEKTGKGVLRHIYTRVAAVTGEVMVCFIINKDDLPENVKQRIVEKLTGLSLNSMKGNLNKPEKNIASICLNVNKQATNVIMGEKIINIYGSDVITDYIGDIRFELSPQSFFQVNPKQTKKLYDVALEYAALTGNEIVWDLYCGIGTISLFLAKKAKSVVGVEIVPAAVENAKKNAVINGIDNAMFYAGKAEEVVPRMYEESAGNLAADVVVVDPPRKGCDQALLDTIVKMAPKRLVYVSCDPATLARDVAWLGENGFKVEKFRCTDMFGMGAHVETVVLMSKVK